MYILRASDGRVEQVSPRWEDVLVQFHGLLSWSVDLVSQGRPRLKKNTMNWEQRVS